jgi:hypothetical protein
MPGWYKPSQKANEFEECQSVYPLQEEPEEEVQCLICDTYGVRHSEVYHSMYDPYAPVEIWGRSDGSTMTREQYEAERNE